MTEEKETVDAKEAGKQAAENNTSKPWFVLLYVGVSAVVVLGVLATAGILLYQNLTKNTGSVADSGVVAFEESFDEGIRNSLDTIAFEQFEDADDIDEIVDLEELTQTITENAETLGGEPLEYEELEGNTVRYAMVIDGEFDTPDGVLTVKGNFEIIEEIPEGYSDYYQQDFNDIEDMLDYFGSDDFTELIEEGGKSQLIAKLDIKLQSGLTSFVGAFEGNMYVEGYNVYFELVELEIPLFLLNEEQQSMYEEALSYEGDVILVNLEAAVELFQETINRDDFRDLMEEIYGDVEFDSENYVNTQEFEDALNELLKELSDEEKEAIASAGPKVRDRINDMLADIELFSNVEDLDSIAFLEDATCSEGEVNIESVVDELESGIEDIYVILSEEDAFEIDEDELEEELDSLEESFEELRDGIDEVEFEMSISACAKDERLVGFGVEVAFEYEDTYTTDVTDVNLAIEFAMDTDSDFEIKIPTSSIDYTEEVNEFVDELDLVLKEIDFSDSASLVDMYYGFLFGMMYGYNPYTSSPYVESPYYDLDSEDDYYYEDFDGTNDVLYY